MSRLGLISCFLVITTQLLGQEVQQNLIGRSAPRPYYPQKVSSHHLKLNYYYDRSGKWVKFSDWIPKQQRQFQPNFLEDFYELVGLQLDYGINDLKENIYFLQAGLNSRFRHPSRALAKIENEEQYARYRNLMFMAMHYQIMRHYLQLASKFDKRYFYFYDTDFSDRYEKLFMIARSYYFEAYPFWQKTKKYAQEARNHRVHVALASLESLMYQITIGDVDFDRIIAKHVRRVEAKLDFTNRFLDQEGRPRPVKQAMEEELKNWQSPLPKQ